MHRRVVPALIALTLTSAAMADVIIHTRSTEFRSAHSYPFGPPWGPQSYSDYVYVNVLGPTGSGVVDLVTPHNEHFLSTASSTQISATMRGSTGYGQINYRDSWSTSTWFAVVFEVTQSPIPVTININGTLFPRMGDPNNPITGFALTITDCASGQTVFDAVRDTPPAIPGGLGDVQWDHASWSGTLAPGRYTLVSQGRPEGVYSAGGGSGGSGSSYVTFAVNFGPNASPAAAPTPSTATGLALLGLAAARRRR